jgi:hypothetical protein
VGAEDSWWKLFDPLILLRISGGEMTDLQVKYKKIEIVIKRRDEVQTSSYA